MKEGKEEADEKEGGSTKNMTGRHDETNENSASILSPADPLLSAVEEESQQNISCQNVRLRLHDT
jgi:hypothetical protein